MFLYHLLIYYKILKDEIEISQFSITRILKQLKSI